MADEIDVLQGHGFERGPGDVGRGGAARNRR